MHTIPQFEKALLAKQVQIEELKTPTNLVREAIGYKDHKRLTWNAKGECFFHRIPMPEHNLQFDESIPAEDGY